MRHSDSGEEQCTWSREDELARAGAEADTRRLSGESERRLSGGSTVEEEGARQEAALELGRLFQGGAPSASADAAAPSAAPVEGDGAPAVEGEARSHLPHGDGVVAAAADAQAPQPTEEASAAPLAAPTEAAAAATGPATPTCGTAVEAAAPAGGEAPASASAAADAGGAGAEACAAPAQSIKTDAAEANHASHLLGRRGGGATIPVGGAVQVARADSEHLGRRGRVVSAKCGYYQIQLPGPIHAHFRGRDLLQLDADGNVTAPPPPPPRPAASEPRAAPSTRTGDPEAPKWWWQNWEAEQGSRKRRPTQLYEAESSTAHTRQMRGVSYAEEEDEPDEPLAPSAPRAPSVSAYNISLGDTVQVLKAGEYHGAVGDVVGMHNGYYQVQMEAGELINVRGKDLARGRSGQVPAPRAQGQPQPQRRPMDSQRPAAKLVPTPARSAARKHERHSSELGVGHLVKVRRQGANYGRDGKVVAARNGYLIVQVRVS